MAGSLRASRLLGLAREAVLASFFGAGAMDVQHALRFEPGPQLFAE
jgi:hypothetical protein